jgi:hypothetical protein
VETSFAESALNRSERLVFFHFLLRHDLMIMTKVGGTEFAVNL